MGRSITTGGQSTGGAKFGEVQFANIAASDSGDVELIAAVAGKVIRVLGVQLIAVGAGDVYFNDGTADLFGDGTYSIPLSLDGSDGAAGFNLPPTEIGYFQTGAVNRPINVNVSAGVAGSIQYVLVDP